MAERLRSGGAKRFELPGVVVIEWDGPPPVKIVERSPEEAEELARVEAERARKANEDALLWSAG